jgi:hypothetical protein
VDLFRQEGCPFIGLSSGYREWSGAAEHGGLGYREVEREVTGGGIELQGAHEACWRVRIRYGAGFQRGPEGRAAAAFPWFSGQVRERGGKGEERGGQVGATQGF